MSDCDHLAAVFGTVKLPTNFVGESFTYPLDCPSCGEAVVGSATVTRTGVVGENATYRYSVNISPVTSSSSP